MSIRAGCGNGAKTTRRESTASISGNRNSALSSTSGYCASRTARYTFHAAGGDGEFADERREDASEDASAGSHPPRDPSSTSIVLARADITTRPFFFSKGVSPSPSSPKRSPRSSHAARRRECRHRSRSSCLWNTTATVSHSGAPLCRTCDMLALAAAADVLSSRAPRERTEDGAGKCTQLNRCCTSAPAPTARPAWQSLSRSTSSMSRLPSTSHAS